MIGKATTGGSVSGLLNYCYFENSTSKKKNQNIRGEYIFSQNLQVNIAKNGELDMSDIANQFSEVAKLNQNCKQSFWHQSFSFPIEENPTNNLLEKIIIDFSLEFGFYERQMIAFRHYDKEHHHFHIIANRLDLDGRKAVKSSNNYIRINQFCRKMEEKYGLKPLESKRQNTIDGKNEDLKNQYAINLRMLIDENLPKVQSVNELEKILNQNGIKVEKGRGVTFILPDKKIRIKGSDLGKPYSLGNLEKRLKGTFRDGQLNDTELYKLKKIIDKVVMNSKSFEELSLKMSENQYQVSVVGKENKKELKFVKDNFNSKYILSSDLGQDYHFENIFRKLYENNTKSLEPNFDKPLIADFLNSARANHQTDIDLAKIDQSLKKDGGVVGIKFTSLKIKK